ncbi:DEAD/DEAH box helicase family protein [Pontibacter ruber]|uniref:DEAD/DEAH box helicase family protein n=1 Tax=Pontibacter ruber TaxID=1343895 RepID=A0ABW5CV29_9BACT|nr:DEAD/DEAH box helicase family protein [Pontibacter ruber]
MQSLKERLDVVLLQNGADFYKTQVPEVIYRNLRQRYGQRPYQQEAFGRFAFYMDEYRTERWEPLQLLFHMATGSGKTLVMAGLILYLYEQGYRNFLFFVNSTNIIEKTRENFLNAASSKYLFADSLNINGRQVRLKEVENFQGANPEDINIVFSTIQGLHSRLATPRENSLTFDDFEEQKLVLISDEAHHINAETKKRSELNAEEKEELVSWESTVNKIFQAHPENLLLEFTATADLAHPEIGKKYHQKLLFDYPLKEFRRDGYSKEVNVLQADLPAVERALQAVVLSQYRRKLFEKYKKPIKPVVLFKSKTIKDSHTFREEFEQSIKYLKAADLERLRVNAARQAGDQQQLFDNSGSLALHQAFLYFRDNGITLENLVAELKGDFAPEHLISVNSKEESEQKQLAINSLEDESNLYRAVFAVDKLNEGWDVLNLFDIVRLYDTRDTKNGKPGKTTMSEAQLIGRGARYCPFILSPYQPVDKRKYDEEPEHELKIFEELYYHSAYNPRYVQELHTALEEIGLKSREGEEQKPRKAGTEKYKQELEAKASGLPASVRAQVYQVQLHTGHTAISQAFGNGAATTAASVVKIYRLPDLGGHVLRKAMSRLYFYQFSSLQRHLPYLRSGSEFMQSEEYLGGVQVEVAGLPEQVEQLSQEDKLYVALQVLESIARALSATVKSKAENTLVTAG